MGRKLKVLLAIIGVFVLILIVAAALSPPASELPAADEEEPIFIDKPASEMVIALGDMPAGWLLVGENGETTDADGYRDGYRREIVKLNGDVITQDVRTTAWTFNSTEDAEAFFQAQLPTDVSTETRAFGDEAVYWELTADNTYLNIRLANVVWEIELHRDAGVFTWDTSMDWVAEKVVSKAS